MHLEMYFWMTTIIWTGTVLFSVQTSCNLSHFCSHKNQRLKHFIVATINSISRLSCASQCLHMYNCKSFNYGGNQCELNTETSVDHLKDLAPEDGYTYYGREGCPQIPLEVRSTQAVQSVVSTAVKTTPTSTITAASTTQEQTTTVSKTTTRGPVMCDPPWKNMFGRCFKIEPGPLNWTEAWYQCESDIEPGKLVVIGHEGLDKTFQGHLITTLKRDGYKNAWVGLSYEANKWMWVDSTVYKFNDDQWCVQENSPIATCTDDIVDDTTIDKPKKCAQLDQVNLLETSNCTLSLPYICQKKGVMLDNK